MEARKTDSPQLAALSEILLSPLLSATRMATQAGIAKYVRARGRSIEIIRIYSAHQWEQSFASGPNALLLRVDRYSVPRTYYSWPPEELI
jgi:hypothetical protein